MSGAQTEESLEAQRGTWKEMLEAIQAVLQPMMSARRLDKARQVLQKRTQAVRFVFCWQKPADVSAALRTMDQFALQFAEIVGDGGLLLGDTSGGSRNFLTVREWPDVESCCQSLRKAGERKKVLSLEKRFEATWPFNPNML